MKMVMIGTLGFIGLTLLVVLANGPSALVPAPRDSAVSTAAPPPVNTARLKQAEAAVQQAKGVLIHTYECGGTYPDVAYVDGLTWAYLDVDAKEGVLTAMDLVCSEGRGGSVVFVRDRRSARLLGSLINGRVKLPGDPGFRDYGR